VTSDELVAAVRSTFASSTRDGIPAATVADNYRDANTGPHGIRPVHALAALGAPDHIETFTGDGFTIALANKQIAGTYPYTLLAEAVDRESSNEFILTGAWRLYQSESGTTSPVEQFADVVTRFGRTVRFGGFAEAVFIPHLTIPTFEADPMTLLSIEGTGPWRVSIMFRRRGSGDATLSWAYAIDSNAYDDAAAHHAS
jgi:hypothetical protein